MPWKEVSVVDQRAELINDWLTGSYSVSALAIAHGVSRPTAHKWIKRFKAEGRPGLEDRSRRPERSPAKTKPEIRELLIAKRKKRPRWGAPKIRAKILEERPELELPSDRTIHSILAEAGLVKPRRRRRRLRRAERPPSRDRHRRRVRRSAG